MFQLKKFLGLPTKSSETMPPCETDLKPEILEELDPPKIERKYNNYIITAGDKLIFFLRKGANLSEEELNTFNQFFINFYKIRKASKLFFNKSLRDEKGKLRHVFSDDFTETQKYAQILGLDMPDTQIPNSPTETSLLSDFWHITVINYIIATNEQIKNVSQILSKFTNNESSSTDLGTNYNNNSLTTVLEFSKRMIAEFQASIQHQAYREPEVKLNIIRPNINETNVDYEIAFDDGRRLRYDKCDINDRDPYRLTYENKITTKGIEYFKTLFEKYCNYVTFYNLFRTNPGISSFNRKTIKYYSEILEIKLEDHRRDSTEAEKFLKFWYTVRLNLMYLELNHKPAFDSIFSKFKRVDLNKNRPAYIYLLFNEDQIRLMIEEVEDEIKRIHTRFNLNITKDGLIKHFEQNKPSLLYKFDYEKQKELIDGFIFPDMPLSEAELFSRT